jgi:hypothetical protein
MLFWQLPRKLLYSAVVEPRPVISDVTPVGLSRNANTCRINKGWQQATVLQYVVADSCRTKECLDRAIKQSNRITSSALEKESFWLN